MTISFHFFKGFKELVSKIVVLMAHWEASRQNGLVFILLIHGRYKLPFYSGSKYIAQNWFALFSSKHILIIIYETSQNLALHKNARSGQTKNGLVSGRLACTSSKTEILNKIGI